MIETGGGGSRQALYAALGKAHGLQRNASNLRRERGRGGGGGGGAERTAQEGLRPGSAEPVQPPRVHTVLP